MTEILEPSGPMAPAPHAPSALKPMPLGVGSSAPLHDVQFSPWIRRMALGLLCVFLVGPILALFSGWQQYALGAGQVVAFNPVDRPLPVKATVDGTVQKVHVIENQEVEPGDLLVDLVDFDAQIVARLEAQVRAAETDIASNQAKVASLTAEIGFLEAARDEKVLSLQAKVEAAEQKLVSEREKLAGARQIYDFSVQALERLERLSKDAVRELEVMENQAKLRKAKADLRAGEAAVAAAEADLRESRALRESGRNEAEAKVAGTIAKRDTAQGKVAELRGKLEDLRGKLRAQQTQTIRAQRDGKVFRVRVNPSGDVVRKGDLLMTIVPTDVDLAVELMVDGNDASLIQEGRKARLQFEGWPAVQFVGWPSAAIGTFGGVVKQIDATDVGGGQFRLLVVPDVSEAERHQNTPGIDPKTGWPKEQFLRQGVRTKGWVLLNQVPLWYEIWRQLNGFPPAVDPPGESSVSPGGAMGVEPGKVEGGGK